MGNIAHGYRSQQNPIQQHILAHSAGECLAVDAHAVAPCTRGRNCQESAVIALVDIDPAGHIGVVQGIICRGITYDFTDDVAAGGC